MALHKKRIIRRLIPPALLVGGGYMALSALWSMCQTAVYIHETITVTGKVEDLRQRPFESITEALGSGNLSSGGDTAYFPIVSFHFDNGARIAKLALKDPDNVAPGIGAAIELRTYPYDPAAPAEKPWRPEGVHPNRASYLWGGDALGLLFGLTLGGIGYLMLNARRGKAPRKQAKPAPKPQPKPVPAPQKAPAPTPVEAEEPFILTAEPEPAPKKKRTRKPADPNAPKKPRTPRKKKEGDPTAPPKPRKKKAE